MQKPERLLLLLTSIVVWLSSFGQGFSSERLRRNVADLDTNRSLSLAAKLKLMYDWKQMSEAAGLPQDSVYARLLHKIAVDEWYANRNYSLALRLTFQALRINTDGKLDASSAAAVTDFYNIAFFYDNLSALKRSLLYYDSAILFASQGSDPQNVIADSWVNEAYVYFRMGDFEKAVTESSKAMNRALERSDSLTYLSSLNQRAQALFNEGRADAAFGDVRVAIRLALAQHNDFQLANAYREQGVILSGMRSFANAESSYSQGIAARLRTKNSPQISGDYNDFGNFYSDSLKSYQKAAKCYRFAIEYAKNEADSIKLATAYLNLGRNYVYQRDYNESISCYVRANAYLKIGAADDFTRNPTSVELATIGNKSLIQTLFDSKTALLLRLYRQTRAVKWLNACLATALLNDSLIRDIRHEQLGEQSKLYWRNRTWDFYADALEACYYANNDSLAFHFMEESRAVLLQDKLNELGANAYLPPAEAAKEARLQVAIFERQQKLNSATGISAETTAALQELLAAKDSMEQYIHSFEADHPAYYQYKYADETQSLAALRGFLSEHGERFIEYFTAGTVCYALCVEPAKVRFVRMIGGNSPIEDQLAEFVRFCSDENALSKHFSEFVTSGNQLFRLLFQSFGLPPGRVIICQDNVLVPFEALSTDSLRPEFLIKRYSFSYVYSARYLMNRLEETAGKGDFLGIAPVKFGAYKDLPDLRLSETALRTCSAPYNRSELLLNGDANRQNFIRQVCNYTITTILTHARADSSDVEPALFMNDSVIHLSDLQLLRKPASRLVILSACQTNIGKNWNGEGIYSLARGFSAAGIPAVAATQWVADELAIYTISEKFNEYISDGMAKDEALQKAKLYYMFQDKRGSLLPCYWADMILIGNAEPVKIPRNRNTVWITIVLVLILLSGGFALFRFTLRDGGLK
jgi:tetratricopeptide (TPR) repeat protein